MSDPVDKAPAQTGFLSEPMELPGICLFGLFILAKAEELGREASPGHFESREGLGPVGARIVAETLYGLIELDGRSYLANNRNLDPRNTEVGVTTLGEMLTYGQ